MISGPGQHLAGNNAVLVPASQQQLCGAWLAPGHLPPFAGLPPVLTHGSRSSLALAHAAACGALAALLLLLLLLLLAAVALRRQQRCLEWLAAAGASDAGCDSVAASPEALCQAAAPAAAAAAASSAVPPPAAPEQPAAGQPAGTAVACGLQRWRAAVSSAAMHLVQRRMQAGDAHAPAAALASERPDEPDGAGLQLLRRLGCGSFGCCYLALWRGRRVAAKLMQLPAGALDELEQQLGGPRAAQQLPALGASPCRAGRWHAQQAARSHAPHMAVMEAAIASTLGGSHPNLVAVYDCRISPLVTASGSSTSSSSGSLSSGTAGASGSGSDDLAGTASSDGSGPPGGARVCGWQVALIMEFCDAGTLREALDRQLLPRDASGCTLPGVVLALASDLAAAMTRLESEGFVHGDIKPANALLTTNGAGSLERAACADAWSPGSKPLTVRLADFGLTVPLPGSATHASLVARGTLAHMSPELLLHGRVSSASDVWAFGILLSELITGRRAFAGVPLALLPHAVAVQGMRPSWPADLPAAYAGLAKLAESCWAQEPRDRPSFHAILAQLQALQAAALQQHQALLGRQLACELAVASQAAQPRQLAPHQATASPLPPAQQAQQLPARQLPQQCRPRGAARGLCACDWSEVVAAPDGGWV